MNDVVDGRPGFLDLDLFELPGYKAYPDILNSMLIVFAMHLRNALKGGEF